MLNSLSLINKARAKSSGKPSTASLKKHMKGVPEIKLKDIYVMPTRGFFKNISL